MTVKELKAVLEGCNDEARVYVRDVFALQTPAIHNKEVEDMNIFHNQTDNPDCGFDVIIDFTR